MNPVPEYKVQVVWSEEDRAFIARCPNFPGVSAFSESAAQALAEAHVALRPAVATYQDEGWPLPEPQPAG